jgi:hypothetical protein
MRGMEREKRGEVWTSLDGQRCLTYTKGILETSHTESIQAKNACGEGIATFPTLLFKRKTLPINQYRQATTQTYSTNQLKNSAFKVLVIIFLLVQQILLNASVLVISQ